MTDAPIDEGLRRRFEAHRLAGGTDPIDAYLPDVASVTFAATLEEIVAIDLEFRWKRWAVEGERAADLPDLATYSSLLERLADDTVRSRLALELERLRGRFARVTAREGARLAHYVLRTCVGRGAFAEVWRASDEKLRRDVAVKLARPEVAGDPQVVARLLREAQSAARLRHPGIVSVHDVGEWRGQPYIVSEFVEGRTLARALHERRFDSDDSARIVLAVAEALDYAHAFGVVHRDVKPANVLLDADGRPRLADFGLAQLQAADVALTRHGEVLGTPAYMSPEQARGDVRDADARSDVYGLGVVLYEMLTGVLPFERGSSQGLLYAVVHEEPPTPRTRAPGVPSELDTICRKAMAKEPDRRYPTARAFAEDLRRYLERLPIHARPPGPLERSRLWLRRNPALAATIGASVALLLLVGGTGLARILAERQKFRDERDRANAHLGRSLVMEARAHLDLHDSEWHGRTMDALRAAAELDVPGRDVAELRELALAAQGAYYGTFRSVERWQTREGTPVSMSASPAGDRIAAVTSTGAIWVRTLPGGQVAAARDVREERATRAVFLSEDLLCVGGVDGRLLLYGVSDLAPAGDSVARASAVQGLAASPSQGLVAAGRENGSIDVWRIDPVKRRLDLVVELPGHEGGTLALHFSPDGRRLASGGMDRWVRVWNLACGRVEASHLATDPPRAIDYCRTRDEVAWCTTETAGWGSFRFRPRKLSASWPGLHLSAARAVAFVGDVGILTASADGTLRVTSLQHYAITEAKADAGPVSTMVLVPGTRLVVAGHAGGEVVVWDYGEPEGRQTFFTPHAARFVPGTARLVTGSEAIDHDTRGRAIRHDLPQPSVNSMCATGDRIACGCSDGGVLLTTGGTSPRRVSVGASAITCVTASAGRIVIGDEDGTVRFLTAQGDPAGTDAPLSLGIVHALAAGADGALVAVAQFGAVLLRPTGERVSLSSETRETGAAAATGDLVAISGTDGRIELFDTRGAAPVRSLHAPAGAVTALAFADAGRRLVAACGEGAARVFDVSGDGEHDLPRSAAGAATWLAVDPRSDLVALGGHGWADVVDLTSQAVVARLVVGSSACGAFGGEDDGLHVGAREGTMLVWTRKTLDAAARRRGGEDGSRAPPSLLRADRTLVPGRHLDHVWGVAVSPDGNLFATASHDGEIKLWDASTLEIVRDLFRGEGVAWAVAFSSDSRRLAAGIGASITLLDVADASALARLDGHEAQVTSLTFHPTLPFFVSADGVGALRIWDAVDGRALGVLHRAATAVHDLAFSPDGATLAAACGDGHVLVWEHFASPDPREPDRRLDAGGGAAWAVGFDPLGRWFASGTERGNVVLRDLRTFSPLARFAGERRLVRSLSFDDTGRYLAAGCYNSVSVTWDLPALRAVLAPMGLDW